MSILTIINNWRLILIAGAATAFAVLIALFKHRGKKMERLQNEAQAHEKKNEIKKRQDFQVKKIEDDEQDFIIEELKANADKSNSDRIDNW